jgi:CHAT domain-containing protein
VRREGEIVRVDLGASKPVEVAARAFAEVSASGDDPSASHKLACALSHLVWQPLVPYLPRGIRKVYLSPDAALAAVPWGALPGKEPGRHLLDEYAISYVSQAQDLVPWKDAPPPGQGALVLGGVDYERADTKPTETPAPAVPPTVAVLDGAPLGDKFEFLPGTRTEAEGLRARLGADSTLVLGADATEARVRDAARGRRILHIATHGFSRDDLLRGLYDRKGNEEWMSADAERQLAVGHDPMLLSGLALAGANPRAGGGDDDGILTALEASYLNLEGVDLVTLSACETALGTAEAGEGVRGLVQAFQMAGAKNVVASLWDVDDEATRLLMDGFYERLLRKENPLSPADALREASLALRDHKDADGRQRFASPRYWAAFVAYER